MRFGQRFLLILTTGYILLFFSEIYFGNEGSIDEALHLLRQSPLAFASWLSGFTLWYAICAYLMLFVINWMRVRSFWALLLVGALTGWTIEGLIIPAIFAELPFAIIFPSLGWHMLLDVFIGWFLVRAVLKLENYWLTAAMSLALGGFWGVWFSWTWLEGRVIEFDSFAMLAMVSSTIWIICLYLQERLGGDEFKPGRWELIVFGLIVLFLAVAQTLTVGVLFPLVMLPLIVLPLIALKRSSHGINEANLLIDISGPAPAGHYLLLFLVPAGAILTYFVMIQLGWQLELTAFVAFPLACLGILLFLIALGICLGNYRAPQEEQMAQDGRMISR